MPSLCCKPHAKMWLCFGKGACRDEKDTDRDALNESSVLSMRGKLRKASTEVTSLDVRYQTGQKQEDWQGTSGTQETRHLNDMTSKTSMLVWQWHQLEDWQTVTDLYEILVKWRFA